MYKITFEKSWNNKESLTLKLMVNTIVICILNFLSKVRTNSLLNRTEDLYNNPNLILLINKPVAQYGFAVFNARKNLLYTSKI